MNISKKALMSFIMALTSLISMAQPYYHVMKRDGINLTEDTVYNAKTYKIRVDMVKPRPKDAIGGKITIESYDCDRSQLKRSFYFTNKGNVYYNNSEGKFHFEKSQLDYPSGTVSNDHCGHFSWNRTINECIAERPRQAWPNATETDFYFANPENLPKLKEDLGNEEWAVLSYCEWLYVIEYLGERGWKVDGKTCFLIDTTPDKSLLRAIKSKNGGKTMSKEDFTLYEAQGLVCLPASGYVCYDDYISAPIFCDQAYRGDYWSCTHQNWQKWSPSVFASKMRFDLVEAAMWGFTRNNRCAVRLVILAD